MKFPVILLAVTASSIPAAALPLGSYYGDLYARNAYPKPVKEAGRHLLGARNPELKPRDLEEREVLEGLYVRDAEAVKVEWINGSAPQDKETKRMWEKHACDALEKYNCENGQIR